MGCRVTRQIVTSTIRTQIASFMPERTAATAEVIGVGIDSVHQKCITQRVAGCVETRPYETVASACY